MMEKNSSDVTTKLILLLVSKDEWNSKEDTVWQVQENFILCTVLFHLLNLSDVEQ